MNTEELGYYLFMDNEEIKRKDQKENTVERKVNLELNPFFMGESPTQDRLKEIE